MTSKFVKRRQAILEAQVNRQLEQIEELNRDGAALLDIQQTAYDNRINPDADPAAKVVSGKERDELLSRCFRWLDVRELTSNEEGRFETDESGIGALADMILETGYTSPIVVREEEEGGETVVRVVDGERRALAHRRLGETVAEKWYMVPARYFVLGELSDEGARLMASALNLGRETAGERGPRAEG